MNLDVAGDLAVLVENNRTGFDDSVEHEEQSMAVAQEERSMVVELEETSMAVLWKETSATAALEEMSDCAD